jgi:hypothetical protein
MRAKKVFEGVKDVLKPKSKEEIENMVLKLSKKDFKEFASKNLDIALEPYMKKYKLDEDTAKFEIFTQSRADYQLHHKEVQRIINKWKRNKDIDKLKKYDKIITKIIKAPESKKKIKDILKYESHQKKDLISDIVWYKRKDLVKKYRDLLKSYDFQFKQTGGGSNWGRDKSHDVRVRLTADMLKFLIDQGFKEPYHVYSVGYGDMERVLKYSTKEDLIEILNIITSYDSFERKQPYRGGFSNIFIILKHARETNNQELYNAFIDQEPGFEKQYAEGLATKRRLGGNWNW